MQKVDIFVLQVSGACFQLFPAQCDVGCLFVMIMKAGKPHPVFPLHLLMIICPADVHPADVT